LRGTFSLLTLCVSIRFLRTNVSTISTLFSNPNKGAKKVLAKYNLMNEKGSAAIVLQENVIELTYNDEIRVKPNPTIQGNRGKLLELLMKLKRKGLKPKK
jgi:hypothetical protein